MTLVSQLKASRQSIVDELELEAADADPNEAPGVAWSSHRSDLLKQLMELDKAIIRHEGLVELQSQALG